MVRQQESADKVVKNPKTRSSGGKGRKRKTSAFNKFMQTEIARLKEEQPEMGHKERFKLATDNWKTAKENPRRTA